MWNYKEILLWFIILLLQMYYVTMIIVEINLYFMWLTFLFYWEIFCSQTKIFRLSTLIPLFSGIQVSSQIHLPDKLPKKMQAIYRRLQDVFDEFPWCSISFLKLFFHVCLYFGSHLLSGIVLCECMCLTQFSSFQTLFQTPHWVHRIQNTRYNKTQKKHRIKLQF